MTYLQPGICMLIALAAIGAVWRGPAGRRLRIVAAAGLLLWTSPPIAALFSATLERQYAFGLPAGNPGAIVVLSSNAHPRDLSEPEVLPGYGTYLRCRYAAWLYKHWKPLPIVLTGGVERIGGEALVLADVMKQMMEEEGVPPQALWVERRSASTYENALFSADLLREKKIGEVALVTEAYHMPRSVAAFRKQGLIVDAAPCAARSIGFEWKWTAFVPGARAIADNEDALHEWVGIIWYRIKGRL